VTNLNTIKYKYINTNETGNAKGVTRDG